ncbi:MAG: hypothetical protein ABIZ80_00475, partial [Bryobacteraceae bacterium]
VWSSLPLELLAVVFEPGLPAPLVQALSLSIDRAAIHNVLLQRQGAPAGGLLPDWLSGYASLFAAPRDISRARQAARQQPLTLGYNPLDTLARAIAERIAVDSREAGILVRPVAQGAAQARLVRLRMPSMSAGPALAGLAVALGSRDPLTPPPSAELQYTVERNLMEERRVIPVCHLPESYALAPRVKNWSPARWGAWRIEKVWLGPDKP